MKNDEWMHRETLTKVGVLDIGEAGGGRHYRLPEATHDSDHTTLRHELTD